MDKGFWEHVERSAMQEMNQKLTEILPGGIAGFRSGERELLFYSPGLAALVGYTPDDPALEEEDWYYDRICPEDRAWIGKEAARQLDQQGRAELVYRLRKPDGGTLWVKQYSGLVESGALGSYFLCLILDYSETKRAQTEAARTADQMNSIVNAIPGGVARLSLEEGLPVLLASDGFYRRTGESREEYEAPPTNGMALYHVVPEDRAEILQAIRTLVATDQPVRVEYRLRRKEGGVCWSTAYFSRADETDGRPVVDAVFLDSTETKRLEREGRINAERYQIVSEQSQDIIFDWDMETDLIYHSAALRDKLGVHLPEKLKIQDLFATQLYAEEDRAVVETAARMAHRGARYQETEYRLRHADGTLIWFRARVTTLFDDGGKPIRAIGVLTDINHYKQANAELQEKAERDLLTGLLNRMTFEEKLAGRVAGCKTEQVHAFYLVDIDNFKEINDLMGHERGDRLLAEVARRLKTQFRGEDLVARMGGDEFAVFVADLPSHRSAEERAEQMRRALYHPEVDGGLSVSVGVALCPDHGQSFRDLYRRADVALYTSKRRGRNCWSLYEPPT